MKISYRHQAALAAALLAIAMCVPALAQAAQGQPVTLPAGNAALLMFSTIAGAVFRPLIEFAVSKINNVPNQVAGALNAGAFVLLYAAGWGLVGGKGGAPSDLISWLQGALDAIGMGSVVMSVYGGVKAVKP